MNGKHNHDHPPPNMNCFPNILLFVLWYKLETFAFEYFPFILPSSTIIKMSIWYVYVYLCISYSALCIRIDTAFQSEMCFKIGIITVIYDVFVSTKVNITQLYINILTSLVPNSIHHVPQCLYEYLKII